MTLDKLPDFSTRLLLDVWKDKGEYAELSLGMLLMLINKTLLRSSGPCWLLVAYTAEVLFSPEICHIGELTSALA